MEIEAFTDQYDEVAPLYRLSAVALRVRNRDRWIAKHDGHIVAAAETLLRPDDRLFVSFKGEPTAAPHLARALAERFGRTLHATADEASPLAEALISGGCVIEMTSEQFMVTFEAALRFVRNSTAPSRYELFAAANCDHDRLFALDNDLRSLVPGTDGWAGNRTWFDGELADPAAYRVAADVITDEYVGLARIWRNPDGPRFGLIGVLPAHRHPSPAAALLRTTLTEASKWGFESFTTETSLSNRVVHPRLLRIGTPVGRFHQLVLEPYAVVRTP